MKYPHLLIKLSPFPFIPGILATIVYTLFTDILIQKKSQRYTFYTSTDKVKIFYIDLTYLCLGIWIIVTGLYNTLLTYLCYHRNSPICLFDRPINNVNIIIYPFDMLNHYFTYPFCTTLLTFLQAYGSHKYPLTKTVARLHSYIIVHAGLWVIVTTSYSMLVHVRIKHNIIFPFDRSTSLFLYKKLYSNKTVYEDFIMLNYPSPFWVKICT